MPFFMIALGALGIIGGGVCLAWGLPYLVLEQGFTYAIIGSVLMTGGILLIALGLLLREVRAMAGRIGGFSAQDAAAAIAAGAVAAGSAVAAGIVAGQTQPDEPKPAGKDEAQGELPLDAAKEPDAASEPRRELAEAAIAEAPPAEAPMSEQPATGPDLAALQEDTPPPEPVVPAESAVSSEIILPPTLTLPPVPAWPPAASWSNLDELPAPKRSVDEQDRKENALESAASSAVAPMAPMPPAPSDDGDPFERLRRSLMLGEKPVRADALAAGMTPGARAEAPAFPDPPPREDTLPASVLQDEPVQDDVIADAAMPEPEDHAEAAVAEAAAGLAPDAGDGRTEEPQRDDDGAEPADTASEAGEAGAETSSTAEGPAISAEGIVSVRRIGDSTYTMYADGSVKAETADTVLHFATVAELKAHLANPMR